MRFANMKFSGLGMAALSLLEAIPSSGWALPSLQSYPLVCILPCHNMLVVVMLTVNYAARQY